MAASFRTSNPVWNEKTFSRYGGFAQTESMTVHGAVLKTGIIFAIMVAAATVSRSMTARNPALVGPFWVIGAIGGLAMVVIGAFKPATAPVTAPLYAVAEGLFLGAISMLFDAIYPGIVPQAVGLTFCVAAIMLVLYSMRVLQATPAFTKGVVAATGAIFLMYLISWILGMFGVTVPYIHGSGIIGILFSLFVVVIAALNLVLDFALIERGSEHGAPRYMEWYAGMGLMVTLVWLYINILILLAKLQRR